MFSNLLFVPAPPPPWDEGPFSFALNLTLLSPDALATATFSGLGWPEAPALPGLIAASSSIPLSEDSSPAGMAEALRSAMMDFLDFLLSLAALDEVHLGPFSSSTAMAWRPPAAMATRGVGDRFARG